MHFYRGEFTAGAKYNKNLKRHLKGVLDVLSHFKFTWSPDGWCVLGGWRVFLEALHLQPRGDGIDFYRVRAFVASALFQTDLLPYGILSVALLFGQEGSSQDCAFG